MAELVVRVQDKVNEDFYLDCQCTKRGDVIEVRPDGWAWSKLERSNPDWRIIRVPMSVSEAQAFLAPELNTDPKNPSKTLQRRAFKIDLENQKLDAETLAVLADSKRDVPVYETKLALADVRDLKQAKPAIEDPAVFGKSPNIF